MDDHAALASTRTLHAIHSQMRELERSFPGSARMRDEHTALQWMVSIASTHCPGELGRALRKSRHERLVLHVDFADDFPQEPPFLRVVSPVFESMTGHITAGGSLCLEVLTVTAGANGWNPSIRMATLLVGILVAISDGGPRIQRGSGVYRDESARAAFKRVATRYGWKVPAFL